MPHVAARDGVRLYYEEAGQRHAGRSSCTNMPADYRTWEPQMRFFSRAHRCITYSQRGYPPSDIPTDAGRIQPGHRPRRRLALMDALKIEKGAHRRPFHGRLHGAACRHRCTGALHFGDGRRLRLRDRARTSKRREEMRRSPPKIGKMFAEEGIKAAAAKYADAPDAPGAQEQGPAWLRRIRAACSSEHSAKATR